MTKKRITYKEMDVGTRFVHPIYDRKLIRPDINWKKASIFAVMFMIANCLISKAVYTYLLGYGRICNIYDMVSYILIVIWCMLYQGIICSRPIILWAIKVYQRYASAQTRLMCCYIPSCSEYAILAIKKYGTFYGGCKALCRIIKCGSYGGEDYP